MKTKQELLDFYGVEMGKTYTITKVNDERLNRYCGLKFKIGESRFALGGVDIAFDTNGWSSIMLLNVCDYEEFKTILDDKEREYLQKYVMDNPALKGKVDSILKDGDDFYDALVIHLNNRCYVFLPRFKKNTMYKNMKRDKQYTPQELGLEE